MEEEPSSESDLAFLFEFTSTTIVLAHPTPATTAARRPTTAFFCHFSSAFLLENRDVACFFKNKEIRSLIVFELLYLNRTSLVKIEGG